MKETNMQKTLVVGATTLSLLFGGAGIANATELIDTAPATTTTVAQAAEEEDGDNTGLWGLAGLLGLLGLLGLKKRRDADYPATRGVAGGPTTPRA
jgi:LPXTG-motif cell wall-anchored protein